MRERLYCCNGTYSRDVNGWHYPWGEPVPGASDLILSDMMALDTTLETADQVRRFRPLNADERRWLAGEPTVTDHLWLSPRHNGGGPHVGDLIVGMQAPELHILTMLTVGDIAEVAGVSKATIDSYRYRGVLPKPQATSGRTPLWARPIIRHWLATRSGPGWRSDLYGERDTANGGGPETGRAASADGRADGRA
jgi:predicted DNA-binding transcriptional regulator AlpA